uniref:Uncharacterized protein n=1 Tax=Cucumis melo TaxID=3656 RepID=A0A9I9ELM3_CUCME
MLAGVLGRPHYDKDDRSAGRAPLHRRTNFFMTNLEDILESLIYYTFMFNALIEHIYTSKGLSHVLTSVEIELPVPDTLPTLFYKPSDVRTASRVCWEGFRGFHCMVFHVEYSISKIVGPTRIIRGDDVCWLHVVFRAKTAGGPREGVFRAKTAGGLEGGVTFSLLSIKNPKFCYVQKLYQLLHCEYPITSFPSVPNFFSNAPTLTNLINLFASPNEIASSPIPLSDSSFTDLIPG